MKKTLAVLLVLSLPILSWSQRTNTDKAIPSSVITLNEGIYLSVEEFLSNSPSISCPFEVHNNLSDYYNDSDERNEYILTYRDDMGYRKVLGAREIWGYCNSEGIFKSFQGKSFELVHLGAISVLRYKQQHQRNTVAQILSLYALGNSVVSMGAHDLLFHLRTDSVVIPTLQNIRRLISDDAVLYNDYQSDRKTDYYEKNLIFLQKYNEKYPLVITETGILVPDRQSSVELVDKQP